MDPVETAQQLIAIESPTDCPNTAVSDFMQERLTALGFAVQRQEYVDLQGIAKVSLAAKREPANGRADRQPGIGFFCHSDVVSVEGWNCPYGGPWDGVLREGRLWGRGACDMKGPTAAALAALAQLPLSEQRGPLYFFATGDEECGMSGAQLLAQQSEFLAEMVAQRAVGIIGEPTELRVVNSHKGGCHLNVSSEGIAAHSSLAEGRNANWQLIPYLAYLQQVADRCESDSGLRNESFSPPTLSLNLVLENAPSAANITVGRATCRLFFRPMPGTAWETLLEEMCDVARQMKLQVHCLPPLSPLHTAVESDCVQTALQLLGQAEPQAVSYATDGCCFPQLQELIVLGPGSIAQAHRPDEWIEVQQLLRGVEVYSHLFRHFAYG
ncbi:MAG: M20/M25/M40 family metallo-hydrolase [Planctomycetales bacterium]|nr:M20/M25/M40 family metallo-hydrolase [Planctomycetales bacterium]